MNEGRTVFAQLMDYVPHHHFRRCVERDKGNARTYRFRCWDQFLCMAFGQLTYRESLRDIEVCLRTLQPQLYHAGFRARVSRSTLAVANEKRDWRIYADFAQVLIHEARRLYVDEPFGAGSRRDGVRTRFHHHRPMSVAFPLGSLQIREGVR